MSGHESARSVVGRSDSYQRVDWIVYTAWVGSCWGFASHRRVVWVGRRAAARCRPRLPGFRSAAAIFTLAIALDTIDHRTIYKEAMRGGEALVHPPHHRGGNLSTVMRWRRVLRGATYAIPALVLTTLSFIYSLVDGGHALARYLTHKSDVVEMWSHVFIMMGHGT